MYKTILGIETSCDETAAAVLQKDNKDIKVLSNIITSSASLQATFGGVIPEQAAREQLKAIIPVIETAIKDSGLAVKEIDAIAVTYGPGLIGSLLIGTETAKTLALTWNKPLIPINHLIGHFYANWIVSPSLRGVHPTLQSRFRRKGVLSSQDVSLASTEIASEEAPRNDVVIDGEVPSFPIIGLLVSGGHTDLVLFTDHNQYKYLGGTRDDAAGECFDKCARLLGLPYPGGPEISRLAKTGDHTKIKLPLPMIDSGDLDFSFSGLKTAVSNIVKGPNPRGTRDTPGTRGTFTANLAASIEATIVEVLVKKTLQAAKKYHIDQVMIAGGVAANQMLSEAFRTKSHVKLFSPSHNIFCTDNAGMITSAAFFAKETIAPLKLQANPNLSL